MKKGVGALAISIVVAGTAVYLTASSASADMFEDLPGMQMAEEAVKGDVPTSSRTAPAASVEAGRASAPAPRDSTAQAPSDPLIDKSTVEAVPGGGVLADTFSPAASLQPDGFMGLLAVAVVVFFTRFLFRLNDLGRR